VNLFMAKVKMEDILKQIEDMSVLELSELVKALEEKFGVTAAAPVAVAQGPVADAASDGGDPAEEQTIFNVWIESAGENKLGVIKALRELAPTLGLKEAKDLVDAAPKEVITGVNKVTSEEAKKKLTEAGATVELK
jgi:large subunit ribosomal protein L7/L12